MHRGLGVGEKGGRSWRNRWYKLCWWYGNDGGPDTRDVRASIGNGGGSGGGESRNDGGIVGDSGRIAGGGEKDGGGGNTLAEDKNDSGRGDTSQTGFGNGG